MFRQIRRSVGTSINREVDGINFKPISSLTETPGIYFRDLNDDVVAHIYWQATNLTDGEQSVDVVLLKMDGGVQTTVIDTRITVLTNGAGQIVSPHGVTALDAADGTIAAELRDGEFVGQMKTIYMAVDGNVASITIAKYLSDGGADTEVSAQTATFDLVGELLTLQWGGVAWTATRASCGGI